jgi:thiol:disulfide interchange protein DsbD
VVGVFFLWTGLSRSGLVAGQAFSSSGMAGSAALALDSEPGFEVTKGLRWHRDFAAARETADETGLPIFVDFYAHWCANCKVFSKQAAEAGPLRDALESVVLAKIYDTDAVFEEFRSDPRYPELKVGLPFFVILSSDGEFVWKGTDYRDHETFIRELERARSLSSGQAQAGAENRPADDPEEGA